MLLKAEPVRLKSFTMATNVVGRKATSRLPTNELITVLT